MIKLGKFISVLVKRLTLCFTLIVMTFTVVGIIANVQSMGKGLAVAQLMDFFVFSALFAISFGIADFVKNSLILKRTLQFVLSLASLIFVFLTGDSFKSYLAGMQNPLFSIVAITFFFVVVYTAVALVVLVFGYIKNRVTNSGKEYDKMFDTTKQ